VIILYRYQLWVCLMRYISGYLADNFSWFKGVNFSICIPCPRTYMWNYVDDLGFCIIEDNFTMQHYIRYITQSI